MRLALAQTVIQPWGMFLLPLAMIVIAPFPRLYAFYQNITVFGGQDDDDLRSLSRRAWQQAQLWPRQNALSIWMLSPWLLITGATLLLAFTPFLSGIEGGRLFAILVYPVFVFLLILSPLGVILAANLSAALIMLPWILKTVLGIQTVFSSGPLHMINSTFFAVICGLCYLCLAPLIKAVYVLRCFYGDALQTGENLRVELRWLTKTRKAGVSLAIVLFCVLTVINFHAEAEEGRGTGHSYTTISPAKLDRSLQDVLNQPEYAWRMARERNKKHTERTTPPFLLRAMNTLKDWGKTIGGWFKKIGSWFRSIGEWFRRLFLRTKSEKQEISNGFPAQFEGATKVQMLLYVLLAAVACVAALLLWRSIKNRNFKPAETEIELEQAEPDLTDEEVDARQLPPDEWLTLAHSLADRGELRLALRALYLAGLACLAEQHLLTIAKYKSDWEYEKELQRRSHAVPDLPSLFLENMHIFQRSWYGVHEVSREMLEQVTANYESLKNFVTTGPE